MASVVPQNDARSGASEGLDLGTEILVGGAVAAGEDDRDARAVCFRVKTQAIGRNDLSH